MALAHSAHQHQGTQTLLLILMELMIYAGLSVMELHSSTADITVNFYQTLTTAIVGADQSLCGTLTSGALGGNTPTIGTAAWSIVSGGTGIFSALFATAVQHSLPMLQEHMIYAGQSATELYFKYSRYYCYLLQ